jgi:hypothetical protein
MVTQPERENALLQSAYANTRSDTAEGGNELSIFLNFYGERFVKARPLASHAGEETRPYSR